MHDFTIENHGSIFLLRPNTVVAREWIVQNIQPDAQWYGDAVAVEHRYIDDIIDGITNAGMTIRRR